MKTIIVDTNIVIRYLYDQASPLHLKAIQYFIDAAQGKQAILIDNIIVAEIIWVLSSVYKTPKNLLLPSLIQFISRPWLKIASKALILQSLGYFSAHNLSYIDCYLHCLAGSKNIPLATFDTKLSKQK